MGKKKSAAEMMAPAPGVPIRHILFAVHGAGHATKTWDMLEDAANLSRTLNFVARELCQLNGEV
jgi:hypothetical protein